MLKHYVEFFYCGSFFSETDVKLIKNRRELFTIPKGCYGYRFFDREEAEQKGEMLWGKKKNYSGIYYFGEVMSLKEVKEQRLSIRGSKMLINNMEGNGWKRIVKTRMGNFQPFSKRDKIIEVNNETT
ncbi:MAG: hypothetical protein V3V81_07880 [Candidatus Bathyarchaeia archaeon]